jgi:hypothetical protein
MRALAKFQTGILRVENPPISAINVVRAPDSTTTNVTVKIRFAFDAIRVVANGGRTVRLETKTSSNPQLPAAAASSNSTSPPSFSSISSLESQHASRLENISVKVFQFDIMKSIPDEAITPLRSGLPIEYLYLLATPAQQTIVNRESVSISDRDYLVSVLESGTDPATLSETFPVPDPARKSKTPLVKPGSYYTRPSSSKSSYQKMRLYSSYQVFEQEISMTADEFLSSTVYEFSYLDYTGTPIEFVEVRVQPSTLYTELQKLDYTVGKSLIQHSNYTPALPDIAKYEREIISTSSIVSSEFTQDESYERSRRPRVIRTHYKLLDASRLSIAFESRVIGLPSRRSKISSKPNSTKPAVIPFYINVRGDTVTAVIKSLPPRVIRVGILVRNVTKGDDDFTEVLSTRVNGEKSNSVAFTFPQPDCLYEVKLNVTDRKQRTITSSNTIVFNYATPYRNASIRVSQPALIGDQKVKFTISADFNDAGRQDLVNLINIIGSNNVSSTTLSVDGFTSDPNLYSEVFSCRVEKIDLETGEQTYTKELPLSLQGIDFVDKVPANSGAAYVFSLGMRSPSSLIPSQSTYKFGTFGGRYLASLPSNAAAFDDFRSGAPFEKVDSGIKSIVEVPTTTLRGSVSSITVSQTMRDTNLVEWTYLGDLTEVDHFQVFGSADGAECLLGCSFRQTSYEDSQLYNRVGVVTYRVRPVYVSYEPGESFTVSLYRKSTVPTIVLPLFQNGQQWRQPAVTAVNSSITVDTPETSAQQYEDFFSTEIRRRERRSTSTRGTGTLQRFANASGLASVQIEDRSAPRTTFNPAPEVQSSPLLVPPNLFRTQTLIDRQIDGSSSASTSLTTENSETATESTTSQRISYRRTAR